MKDFTVRVGPVACAVTFRPKDAVLRWDRAEAPLYVFDGNTVPLFDAPGERSVVQEPGEEHKEWKAVEAILRRAVELGLARDSVLFGVGGGVVCDVAAFAASLYMRGCGLVLVPTTLLAMVDASLGGKTGIDYLGYKNLVGSFHPASEIRISIETLSTLPEREYRNGLAELIKHGFLEGGDFLDRIEAGKDEILSRDPAIMTEMVGRSLAVKGHVVEEDFRENGIRAHLNLGHTFAHALESVSGFSDWAHGEAVAWGIAKAMKLGTIMGVTPADYADRVISILAGFGFRLTAPGIDPGKLLEAMRHDKKVRGGRVRFVLQRGRGDTFLTEVRDAEVLRALHDS